MEKIGEGLKAIKGDNCIAIRSTVDERLYVNIYSNLIEICDDWITPKRWLAIAAFIEKEGKG